MIKEKITRVWQMFKKMCRGIKHIYWWTILNPRQEYVELGVALAHHKVVSKMTDRQIKAWNKRARRYNEMLPYKTPFKELT